MRRKFPFEAEIPLEFTFTVQGIGQRKIVLIEFLHAAVSVADERFLVHPEAVYNLPLGGNADKRRQCR